MKLKVTTKEFDVIAILRLALKRNWNLVGRFA